MKSKIKTSSFIGFIFTAVLGTLLHFAFEKSGGNTIVAVVAPVNESVWEHLKLLFFPSILYFVIEFIIYGSSVKNFCSARLFSLFMGLIFIVVGFYVYTGIFGKDNFIVNILIFVVSVAITYAVSSKIMAEGKILLSDNYAIFFVLLATVLIILFMYFTFHPPMCELFRDPISEDFGIIVP